MVAYRLGSGEVPGSKPGKGENFSVKISNWDCSNLNTNIWLPDSRAVFVSLFFLKIQLIYDFLARNNNPDSPHSQGGMKFATQISPLLNFVVKKLLAF